MFAKLLKHEWKANVGLFSLLAGCALGVGCVAAVVLRLLTTYWDQLTEKEELTLILIPAFLFLFFAYIALILYASGTQYILLFRFYKSRFTDEGYLTFTLPVKTSHIFLSSAVNILIWNAITILVVILALVIAIVWGPVWPAEFQQEMQWAFSELQVYGSDPYTPAMVIGYILFVLVSCAYGIVSPMTAVVLGATAAKKHKVIAIIGIMIGISAFYGTISSIVSGIMQFALLAMENQESLILALTPYINSIFPIILTVVGYFLSLHLMKKKLNLP